MRYLEYKMEESPRPTLPYLEYKMEEWAYKPTEYKMEEWAGGRDGRDLMEYGNSLRALARALHALARRVARAWRACWEAEGGIGE